MTVVKIVENAEAKASRPGSNSEMGEVANGTQTIWDLAKRLLRTSALHPPADPVTTSVYGPWPALTKILEFKQLLIPSSHRAHTRNFVKTERLWIKNREQYHGGKKNQRNAQLASGVCIACQPMENIFGCTL